MRAIPQPDNEKRLLLQATNLSKRFRLQRDRQRSLQETFIHLLHRRRSDAEYFWPLRDLSLTVRTGDAIGILGQNGSGKSTLLKLLTGVLQPTTGEIHTNARIASLLELGAGFHPDLTGRENIYLNASILGLKKEAYDYFIISAGADLKGIREDTEHGVHAAAMGGTWQTIIFGFAGLIFLEDKFIIKPALPDKWTRLTVPFKWRGASVILDIRKNYFSLKNESSERNLIFDCEDTEYIIEPKGSCSIKYQAK